MHDKWLFYVRLKYEQYNYKIKQIKQNIRIEWINRLTEQQQKRLYAKF